MAGRLLEGSGHGDGAGPGPGAYDVPTTLGGPAISLAQARARRLAYFYSMFSECFKIGIQTNNLKTQNYHKDFYTDILPTHIFRFIRCKGGIIAISVSHYGHQFSICKKKAYNFGSN